MRLLIVEDERRLALSLAGGLRAEGLDVGADDYVTKPFSYVVLRARIRALLRRRTRAGAPLMTVGDLTVDPGSQRVHRGEEEIVLTAREFAVLEYLAANAEQVVSKRQILEHVWDSAYEGDPNVVEVHVSALRRKLDAPFGRRSIGTVRGSGYRLTADGA